MKVAVLGASGWIGSHILQEAKNRGHQVTAIVRDAAKVKTTEVEIKEFDLENVQALTDIINDFDVVIASIGGRANGEHSVVAKAAAALLSAVAKTQHKRLLWVGGAGSLEVAPGVSLLSLPEFPPEYKAEAIAQGEALEVFRQTQADVNWTFVSPAAEIFPGESLAAYRVGGDNLLTDENGKSKISVTDYAKAMLDEAENDQHLKQRISVAY